MTNQTYEKITQAIVSQLEQGVKPWQNPWQGGVAGMPVNVASKAEYNGINIVLLWAKAHDAGYESNQWGTFNQWKDWGFTVAKGEKATNILYFRMLDKEDKEGNEYQVPMARSYAVFNECQLKDYNPQAKRSEASLVDSLANVESFVNGTQAIVKHGGNRAFYIPSKDFIQMPDKESFTGTDTSTATECYYSTLLHELTHWTGHTSRLDRHKQCKRYDKQAYAFEELVAELGAAFLCAKLGITDSARADHAQYLHSWLRVIKDNPKAIVQAASLASKACDYLHELQESRPATPAAAQHDINKPAYGEQISLFQLSKSFINRLTN